MRASSGTTSTGSCAAMNQRRSDRTHDSANRRAVAAGAADNRVRVGFAGSLQDRSANGMFSGDGRGLGIQPAIDGLPAARFSELLRVGERGLA